MKEYYEILKLAVHAHGDQKDWSGDPYILHPIIVAKSLHNSDIFYQKAALLHDVVEDTNITLNDLAIFGERMVNAIDALSRRKGKETYFEYIDRLTKNKDAVIIKVADLKHNLSRMGNVTDNDNKKISMTKKYNKALKIVEKAYK